MSVITACLPLLPIFLESVCGLNNNFLDLPDLPYDIIADILSRLPAESVFRCVRICRPLLPLTNDPSFITMQLNRATPVIAYTYQSSVDEHGREKVHHDCVVKRCGQQVDIFFTTETSDKIVTKSLKIAADVGARMRGITACGAFLHGSYHGFLLFRSLLHQSVLFIWNPVTHEQVTVIPPPDKKYSFRGFFYHPKTREYSVLFFSKGNDCFEYSVLGLRTKSFRIIKTYSYEPAIIRKPVILNGVLHWKRHVATPKNVHGVDPDCSNSILLFNIDNEEFSTMSHPGPRCSVWGNHLTMKLMENEGHLCLCIHSPHDELVIWMLEDYEKKSWVKKHISLEPIEVLYGGQHSLHTVGRAIAYDMHKDKIIIAVGDKDLFLYNMRLGSFRRCGKHRINQKTYVQPFYHVDSIASISGRMKQ